MFAAAICVSILLGGLVWALPGRLCDRRATHADVLAGPGIVLAVWIIAACVFAQPGLAQGLDLFRLLAINGAALWACGTVLLLRLRSGRRYRTLWTVAALLIAAIGLEVFVGNAPYFATHGYQPVDLRAYLQDAPADGEPIALNDEHSTLTFTGIHQPLYNVALDGVVYALSVLARRLADLRAAQPVHIHHGDAKFEIGKLFAHGRRPRERHAAWCARWIFPARWIP